MRGITRLRGTQLLVFALLFGAIFTIDATNGPLFYAARLVTGLVALSVVIVPLRLIYVPFAVMMFLMADLTQTSQQVADVGIVPTASIWQLAVGPVSPAILVLLCLLVALVRLSRVTTLRLHRLILVYFLVVAVLVSAFNGYPQESFPRFIADFKILLFFYFSIMFFGAYTRAFPEETLRVIQVFALFFVVSLLVQALISIGRGESSLADSGYLNTSLDSSKGLILAVTFFAVARLVRGRQVALWSAITVISLYVMISYQTRWLVITFLLGLLLTLQLLPMRKRLKVVAWGIPVVSIAAIALIAFESEALRIMLLRFSFLENVGAATSIVDIELARGSAIINSMNHLWERGSVLWGMGYGSWYSDDFFPMADLGISAFDEESLQSGKFYRVHDFFFHFLFKFGVAGLLFYVWVFVQPLRQLWKARRSILRRQGGYELLTVVFGIAPTIVTYMWFTGKGGILSGFYVALCTFFAGVATVGRRPADAPENAVYNHERRS